jgi:glycerophosphoryl diester phosphodiesterase
MPPAPRPLLLGHRGARVPGIPENTFAAFDLALEKSCDGFEFDVRYTRDGRLLICHDPELLGRTLSTTPYADFANTAPCLGDVLARYPTAFLDIELKVAGIQKAVIAALRTHPPQRDYVVSSFLPEVLLELHAESAGIPLGFICDKREELARWPTLPVQFVIPHYKLLSQKLLEQLHAADKKVFVWTVNDPRDITRFSAWGVDAIISDNPELLAQQISS